MDAGKDKFFGGDSNETIAGGTGIDKISGGGGNDVFVFFAPNLTGDKIHIDGANFGTMLDLGVIPDAVFQTRADNKAQNADDRFIFRTTDATLWFDANGNASGGKTLIADLQNGAAMNANDIVII